MLRREALPLYGRTLADALSAPGGDAALTLWPTYSAPGEQGEELDLGWPAFIEVLRTRRPWRGRGNHPGWSAATFAPPLRAPANVRSVSAVVLTFERTSGALIGDFLHSWSAFAGVVYTTADHTTSAHAFVAVFPYARLVALDEHRRTVDMLSVCAAKEKRPFDERARNPARFVHLPGTVPGRPFEAHVLPGARLHVR